jgi:pimeloyl-ACP methyl ester carboxylesterase
MPTIDITRDSAPAPLELFYEDWGQGRPVVLIHGWPVSHKMWEYQLAELPKHGLRTIAYDRRGFGQSSKPWTGYDYDTFADDLKSLLDALDLTDVVLVGFSMGGGEVARYMSRHGGNRVSRVVLIGAVTPFLLKTGDNEDGLDAGVFDEMVAGVEDDRPAFLQSFGKSFFGVGLLSKPVSSATLDWTQSLALPASPKATVDCIRAFSATDFRKDLAGLRVPTLVIHGKDDQTVPLKASGERTAALVPHAEYKVYDDAPHGLYVTHKDRLNEDLIKFALAA